MQLRRASEIVNSNDNNTVIYYKEDPVTILSIDNNIGTAYVKSLHENSRYEVSLEDLCEIEK